MANEVTIDKIEKKEVKTAVADGLVLKGVPVRFEILGLGDYKVGPYVIERKTVADFVGSLKTGHLFSQMSDLANLSKPLLFLEGDVKDFVLAECERCSKFGFKGNPTTVKKVNGALLSIATRYRIPVIYGDALEDLVKLLVDLSAKTEERDEDLIEVERVCTSHFAEKFPLVSLYMTFASMGQPKARELARIEPKLQRLLQNSRKEDKAFWEMYPRKVVNAKTLEHIRKLDDPTQLKR